MLRDRTIEKRVLSTIKKRIADAQAAYDKDCLAIEEERNQKIVVIEIEAEEKKLTRADQLVESIIGPTF